MSGITNSDKGEKGSEDLEELLSTHVSKDYVNCVWTKEDEIDILTAESSPQKLNIAVKVTSPEQLRGEVTETLLKADDVAVSNVKIPKPSSKTSNKKKRLKEKGTAKVPVSRKRKKAPVKKNPKNVVVNQSSEKVAVKKSSEKLPVNKSPKKLPVNKSPMKSKYKLPVKVKLNIFDLKKELKKSSPPLVSAGITIKGNDTMKIKRKNPSDKSLLKNNPTSLKNPTETFLSSDERLPIAYRNLVVQRSLQPYSPKNVDSRFFSGKYFCCNACGDKFVMQTSLTTHIARKTAKFSYVCPVCLVKLSFDNRCSLVLHMLSHGKVADDIELGDIVLLSPSSEENECDAFFKSVTSDSCKCPECSKSVSSLESHLQGKEELHPTSREEKTNKVDSSMSCSQCFFLLPSKCAHSAHLRLHNCEPPHVCPDCGESFLQSTSLSSHMEEDCFYVQKRRVFLCAGCKVVMISLSLFTEHFTAKHLRTGYMCDVCEVLVNSFEDFNTHRVTQHNLQWVDSLSRTAVLCARIECERCPGVSLSLSSLQDHAVSHALDPKFMITVYICKKCKYMFASMELWLEHSNTCQGKTKLAGENTFEINFSDLSVDDLCSFQPSASSEVKTVDSCAESDRLTVNSKSESGIVLSEETGTSVILSVNSPSNETIGQECVGGEPSDVSQSFVFQEGNKLMPETGSLLHSSSKNVLCKLCKKVVSKGMNKAALKKHFTDEHFDIYMKAVHWEMHRKIPGQCEISRISPPWRQKKIKTVQDILKSLNLRPASAVNTPGSDGKVVLRKTNRDCKVNKLPGKRIKASVENGVRVCYKCSFSSDDAEAFGSHIVLHKSNPSDLQCPECGLCFIVLPPLEKHLFVEHAVKSVSSYIRDHGLEENSTSEGEDVMVDVEESDKEELMENQCKVCKDTFETTLLLEKHFRVHGGAFLLASLKAKRSNQST